MASKNVIGGSGGCCRGGNGVLRKLGLTLALGKLGCGVDDGNGCGGCAGCALARGALECAADRELLGGRGERAGMFYLAGSGRAFVVERGNIDAVANGYRCKTKPTAVTRRGGVPLGVTGGLRGTCRSEGGSMRRFTGSLDIGAMRNRG